MDQIFDIILLCFSVVVGFDLLQEKVDVLNVCYKYYFVIVVFEVVLCDKVVGDVVMVSLFGVESVVFLYFVVMVDCNVFVFFVDMQFFFIEMLVY